MLHIIYDFVIGKSDKELIKITSGEQAGADPERVKYAKDMFPLEYLEMEPGDVLFFHCNLLHSRYSIYTMSLKRVKKR